MRNIADRKYIPQIECKTSSCNCGSNPLKSALEARRAATLSDNLCARAGPRLQTRHAFRRLEQFSSHFPFSGRYIFSLDLIFMLWIVCTLSTFPGMSSQVLLFKKTTYQINLYQPEAQRNQFELCSLLELRMRVDSTCMRVVSTV